jgi:hypothetical protein
MNLQEVVTTLMFAQNNMVLPRVMPKFFAIWEGDTVGLSTMMERSLSGQAFPGRKSSFVLSRLSLRWWAEIQAEIRIYQACRDMCHHLGVRRGEGEK